MKYILFFVFSLGSFQILFYPAYAFDKSNNPVVSKTILIFGDSLSAGYGLDQGEDWPTLLDKKVTSEKSGEYRIVNVSISGETTKGGRLRLAKALARFKPDIVVIALGANDGLRGLSIKKMTVNLQQMVQLAKQHNAKILLAGMKIPPNYGKRYASQFENAFALVAKKENTSFLPFLLEGVAQDNSLFQRDQLHPIDKAQPIIMNLVYQYLEPLL